MALTEGLRIELRSQGTRVIAVHAGYIDTDMTAALNRPKISPEEVAARIIEGIRMDQEEVLVDQPSQEVKAVLAATGRGSISEPRLTGTKLSSQHEARRWFFERFDRTYQITAVEIRERWL